MRSQHNRGGSTWLLGRGAGTVRRMEERNEWPKYTFDGCLARRCRL